jgi:hypothetical protein
MVEGSLWQKEARAASSPPREHVVPAACSKRAPVRGCLPLCDQRATPSAPEFRVLSAGRGPEAHRETPAGSKSRQGPSPRSQTEISWRCYLGRVTSDRPIRRCAAATTIALSLSLCLSGTGCDLLEKKPKAEAEAEPERTSAAPAETNASPPQAPPPPTAPSPPPTATAPPTQPLSTAPFPDPSTKKPGGAIPGPLPAPPAPRPGEEQWAKAARSNPQKKAGKIDCFTKSIGDWVRVVCSGPLGQTPILNMSKGDFGNIVDETGETGVYYEWKAGQDIVLDWHLGQDKIGFTAKWDAGAPRPAAVGVFK